MTDKIKCWRCGISVPDVPEDSTPDESLCDRCFAKFEVEQYENDSSTFGADQQKDTMPACRVCESQLTKEF